MHFDIIGVLWLYLHLGYLHFPYCICTYGPIFVLGWTAFAVN